jgi:hypothetical protein
MRMTVGELIKELSNYNPSLEITNEQNFPFNNISSLTDGSIILSSIKPIGICNRSGADVYPSVVDEYSGFCPELDEDLFEFEFTRKE